jgi:hypothetical protein
MSSVRPVTHVPGCAPISRNLEIGGASGERIASNRRDRAARSTEAIGLRDAPRRAPRGAWNQTPRAALRCCAEGRAALPEGGA